jgi:hypothetical protein
MDKIKRNQQRIHLYLTDRQNQITVQQDTSTVEKFKIIQKYIYFIIIFIIIILIIIYFVQPGRLKLLLLCFVGILQHFHVDKTVRIV